MRYLEWTVLFILSGIGIALANFVGFDVGFMDSLPGIVILLAISIVGVVIHKLVPLQLPIVAYVSLLGLLAASPISPAREFVIEAAGKINFTAPLTMVGAYAGMSISGQIKSFLKQGWKMILIGVFVMTGTFLGSALIAQVVMKITGTI
ncbi:MAG TPA: hypothetical protein H9735_05545 [Candidatus Anaerostipes excrementavium]|uniref:DUF340 domain-containing protein n=1 Tax=Candidatus Anaerostipes excrementavium TaxID=2838463 RepID=A0A9D1WUX0_9FIRM|nr:hypothetical protein [uncultured Anaerostipes sp.]HIX67577.1 hypothetical protein [Candidatus Anaerostipes excrementavium]